MKKIEVCVAKSCAPGRTGRLIEEIVQNCCSGMTPRVFFLTVTLSTTLVKLPHE